MIAAGRATTETLPLSLTLVAIVSLLAMALDRSDSPLGEQRAAGRLGPAPGVAPAGLQPSPEEEAIRLQRHADALSRLRLADPALAARVEPAADPAATLAPADLGRLNRLLRQAGVSPQEFLREQRRLARSPALRVGLAAPPPRGLDGD